LLSQKSIRDNFILQLVSASATLIVIFSVILYNYIKISVFEDITQELTKQASTIASSRSTALEQMGVTTLDASFGSTNNPADIKIFIAIRVNQGTNVSFEHTQKEDKKFLTIYYPLEKRKHHFIAVTKDISNTDVLLSKILKNILVINLTAIFLILLGKNRCICEKKCK